MKKWNLIITILLFIFGALCFIFFEARPITIIQNNIEANRLLCGSLSRLGLSILFIWLLYQSNGKKLMIFDRRFLKTLLWSLPCFMVALVNFPLSAILSNDLTITKPNLFGLYIMYVFGVALLEELIFRGILLLLVSDLLRNKRHKPLLTVLICSLIFSLFHLTNLIGANVGSVLLQCLYTFLLGGMLTVTTLKGKNIWLCVLIHAIFNFGGLLVIMQIGEGNPWDLAFWIATVVSALLCAGHILMTLLKLEKDYVSERTF